MRLARRILAAHALAAILGVGCRDRSPDPAAGSGAAKPPRPPAASATFVGREACAGCHAEQFGRWRGSHHDLAMQEATRETVLGNFRNASFKHFGVTTTFSERDGKFFVRTDGPDGKLHDYPVAYTFGVYPLQQYLIPFPGGRYQALNVVWDTRPAKAGGQRWFHLYPKEEVAFSDPLHWTGPYQNWNFMCAECHSTNVRKGYSPETKTYATTWSELDVSCEACHGPGSAHVAWAKAAAGGSAKADDPARGLAVVLKDPAKAVWEMDMKTGIAKRTIPRTSHTEIETCARCHARRSVVDENYVYGQALLQTHRPALLEEGLYFADGQIQDEVYEYGSFLQSKMHAAGVSCSDCHNPHDLKVPVSADRVCAGCHLPEKFASPSHTFHKPGSAGSSCVACHMPTRNYMVVHARRDHSLRVPRPDLSVTLGTPNACTQCHRGKSDRWAAAAAQRWWGDRVRAAPHDGEAIHAGQQELAGAAAALERIVNDPMKPPIRRATAASLLGRNAGQGAAAAIGRALADPDPLVRDGALAAADAFEPRDRLALLSPLLRDPVRTVRVDAARALTAVPRDLMSPAEVADFESALAEYVASQNVDADRAEAHLNLAGVFVDLGELDKAQAEYETALALSPAFGGAYANLADLYRQRGRDDEGEKVLRRGIAAAPADPGVHHALGLSLVRQKRMPEALKELELAATLPPERPHYVYVFAVALDAAGESRQALGVLAAGHRQHPGNREILSALATLSAKGGDRPAAIAWAQKLLALDPQNSDAIRLVERLSAGRSPSER